MRSLWMTWLNGGDKIIGETGNSAVKHYEGRLVGDIASEENKDPLDALLDIVWRRQFANDVLSTATELRC